MIVDLSLAHVTRDLLSFSWPTLVGVSMAQVMGVRRILSRPDPPSMLVVATASVIASVCSAALVLEIMTAPQPVIPGEEEFDWFEYQWSLFKTTMWPVLVAFAIAEMSLVLGAAAASKWIVTTLNLASGLTAGWVMAWWLFMSVHHQSVMLALGPWPWLISVMAATFGVAVSTATWLTARRIVMKTWMRRVGLNAT